MSQGRESYYHQLLGAVLVHPRLKTVLPMAAEPITRQDGEHKNDCERAAAKRLLRQLRRDYPSLKLLVVEDSLSANGPHLELLKELDLRYLIGVKPGDHEALFEAVQVRLRAGQCEEVEVIDARGVECGYRFVNDLPLNQAHPHLRVNYLEYWEGEGDEERLWSWITDIRLTRDNIEPLMRGGRARWKIENETFNTLKTQGYELEHNYGHGQQYLATVFALLTVLAFLVDQAQELGCRLFQAARARFHSRTSLLRAHQSALYRVLHCGLEDAVGCDCRGPRVDGVDPRYLVGECEARCDEPQPEVLSVTDGSLISCP